MGIREDAKLSFMSWVAPNADVDEIIELGREFVYDGFEPVFEKGHAHGLDLAAPPDQLRETRRRFEEAGMPIGALATPLKFALPNRDERQSNTEKLKRYVALADTLGAKAIRVFGGELPAGVEPKAVIDWVSDALAEAVEAAEASSARVVIALETHDSFSNTTYVREVLRQVYSDSLGVTWDLAHPVRYLESVEQAYDNISGKVVHVHVHDMNYSEDGLKAQFCPCGTGFVPIRKAFEFLAQDNYKGLLSVEVINGGEPHDILPMYAKYMRAILAELDPEEA